MKVDYYEFLQISPNAEPETIHRVYRYLGARYHPDNPHSGDTEKFEILRSAYEVLSDPVRRSDYDASRPTRIAEQPPLSDSIDFMDVIDGESNRRLALMAVLYARRRSHPGNPEISLNDLETRMGFPRDYLDFTTWYLKQKALITVGDNACFSLTVQGVDYVESERLQIPTLHKLLTSGSLPPANGSSAHNGHSSANGHAELSNGPAAHRSNGYAEQSNGFAAGSASADDVFSLSGEGQLSTGGHVSTNAHISPDDASFDDRRFGAGDRRVYSAGSKDRRKIVHPHGPVERRSSLTDRRSGKPDRRIKPS